MLRQALTASGSQIADYKYFADGTRRRKITPSATTDTGTGGDQEILEVANQEYTNPDVARRYVRMPGSVDGQMGVGPHLTNCSTRELGPHPQFSLVELLMIDYTGAGCASGCEVWAHQDRLGSTVMTTDHVGAVLDSFTYSPYGESGESTTGFPFRFTGQKLDPETGLYYYKARYYDPKTGRFLRTDPIGYEDQMNLYAYVGNDPLNLIDPTGECYYNRRISQSSPGCRITGKIGYKKDLLYERNKKKGYPMYRNTLQAYDYGFRRSGPDAAFIKFGDPKAIDQLERRILTGPTIESAIEQAIQTGQPAPYQASTSVQSDIPGMGEITLDIQGEVTVNGNEWTLKADVFARPEPYDMNPKPIGERALPAELVARGSDAAGFQEFESLYVGGFTIEAKGDVNETLRY